MKKLFAFLLALLLLFVAGCSRTQTAPVNEEQEDEWGITLRAENVTPFGLTLVCTRNGGDPNIEPYTGRAFSLERLKKGEWKPQHTLVVSDSQVWTLEALGAPYEGSVRWDVGWEFLYGELPPGTYRIKKVFRGYVGMGAFESRPYYAEFTITE